MSPNDKALKDLAEDRYDNSYAYGTDEWHEYENTWTDREDWDEEDFFDEDEEDDF